MRETAVTLAQEVRCGLGKIADNTDYEQIESGLRGVAAALYAIAENVQKVAEMIDLNPPPRRPAL
jgi:hypothetical protein